MKLGPFIKAARTRLGMTPEEFAKLLGWSKASAEKSVSNLESGREDPSIKVLRTILDELNIPLEECFLLPEARATKNATVVMVEKILFRDDRVSARLVGYVQGLADGLDGSNGEDSSHVKVSQRKRTAAK